jgi:hypothetical protein
MGTWLSRRAIGLAVLLVSLSASLAVADFRDNPPPLPGWTHPTRFEDDSNARHGVVLEGSAVLRGSPVIGELSTGSAGREVAVGGTDGRVYVYRANGQLLWSKQVTRPCSTGSDSRLGQINSAPAIGQLFGDGVSYLVVSYGTIEASTCDGGVVAYRGRDGNERWRYSLREKSPTEALHGVISSPALADTDGDKRMEIAFGGFDRNVHLLNADGSDRWTYHAADTVWSSPAFVNVDSDAQLEMVVGTDISANPDMIPPTQDGGFVYAFDTHQRSASGFNEPGSYIWRKFFNQAIFSSPAIGDVLPSNPGAEIVIGTGCYFPIGGSDKRGKFLKVLRLSDGADLQTLNTDVCVQSSPALGDIDDDGILEVVATVSGHGSLGGDGNSHLMAWDATNPKPKWSIIPRNANDGQNDAFGGDLQSPVIADLDGNGSLEVAVATVWSVSVFEGKTGAPLTCQGAACGNQTALFAWYTLKSTPAVDDIDGDGMLDLVIGGSHFYQQSRGLLYAWTGFEGRLNSPAGTQPPSAKAWPMFRGNPEHTGVFTVSKPRQLTVSPSAITTLSRRGAAQTVDVTIKFDDSTAISWSVSEIDRDNILSFNRTTGTATTPLRVTIDPPATLGVYSATIRVQASGQSLDIPVSVRVVNNIFSSYLPLTLR